MQTENVAFKSSVNKQDGCSKDVEVNSRKFVWCLKGFNVDSVSAELGFREIHLRVLSHEPAETRSFHRWAVT